MELPAVAVAALAHGEESARQRALRALLRSPPEALVPHVDVLVWHLSDPRLWVRLHALQVLRSLPAEAWAPHAGAVALRLADDEPEVRKTILEVLRRLPEQVLAEHLDAVAQCLADSVPQVRGAALWFLKGLPEEVVAPHLDAVQRCLADGDSSVRMAALSVLKELPEQVLAPRLDAVAQCMADGDPWAAGAAMGVLNDLPAEVLAPEVLAQRAQELTARFALHSAAATGRMDLCRALVEGGVPVSLRDKWGRSAEDCAKASGQVAIADYLRGCRPATATRVGAGDAFEAAMGDDRPVLQVAWYLIPLEGAAGWLLGAYHSLLAVTVGARGEPAGQCTYVMERAAGAPETGPTAERFRTGIYISRWEDVHANIHSRWAVLPEGAVKDGMTMRFLREFGVWRGPYEVHSNSCHHFAQELFNLCARSAERCQRRRPNMVLTRWAGVLGMLNINVADSRCEVSDVHVPCAPVAVGKGLQCGLYDRYPFPLDGNCSAEVHRGAEDAALLSSWIYGADPKSLPSHLSLLELHPSTDTDPVQWSLVAGAGGSYYWVFRGTQLGGADRERDVLIDIACMPFEIPAGLVVHSQMWVALNQGSLEVCQRAAGLGKLIVCGHSLGGGYALLVGAHLLYLGHSNIEVRTFGAPQVMKPDPRNEVWQLLDAKAAVYVNAWDIVCRLPACRRWVETIPKLACKSFAGCSTVQIDQEGALRKVEHLTACGREYDHVGAVIFIKRGASKAMRLRERGVWRALLDEQPDGFGEDRDLVKHIRSDHAHGAYSEILREIACSA